MAGNRKAQHDISPRMRAAFFEGFCRRAKSLNKTLPEYAEMLWEEDWKACINAMAKFLPQEKKVSGKVEHDHTHKHQFLQETTARLIDELAGKGEDAGDPLSLPH